MEESVSCLRGFAVSAVILYHLGHWRSGNFGVDVFFVISGYLICNSLSHDEQPPKVFLRRRARRIFPLLIVFLSIVTFSIFTGIFPDIDLEKTVLQRSSIDDDESIEAFANGGVATNAPTGGEVIAMVRAMSPPKSTSTLKATRALTTLTTDPVPLTTDPFHTDYVVSFLSVFCGFPNYYFRNLRHGYFAKEAGTVPLLHLWSLGIEWQFYLLCAFLCGIRSRVLQLTERFRNPTSNRLVGFNTIDKRNNLRAFLPLLFLTTLSLTGISSFYFFTWGSVNIWESYFGFEARFWQFCAGGFVAFVKHSKRREVVRRLERIHLSKTNKFVSVWNVFIYRLLECLGYDFSSRIRVYENPLFFEDMLRAFLRVFPQGFGFSLIITPMWLSPPEYFRSYAWIVTVGTVLSLLFSESGSWNFPTSSTDSKRILLRDRETSNATGQIVSIVQKTEVALGLSRMCKREVVEGWKNLLETMGNWSYSMYLWHWSIIVYLNRHSVDVSELHTSIFVIIATSLLSWISFTFVEVRFYPKLHRCGSDVGNGENLTRDSAIVSTFHRSVCLILGILFLSVTRDVIPFVTNHSRNAKLPNRGLFIGTWQSNSWSIKQRQLSSDHVQTQNHGGLLQEAESLQGPLFSLDDERTISSNCFSDIDSPDYPKTSKPSFSNFTVVTSELDVKLDVEACAIGQRNVIGTVVLIGDSHAYAAAGLFDEVLKAKGLKAYVFPYGHTPFLTPKSLESNLNDGKALRNASEMGVDPLKNGIASTRLNLKKTDVTVLPTLSLKDRIKQAKDRDLDYWYELMLMRNRKIMDFVRRTPSIKQIVLASRWSMYGNENEPNHFSHSGLSRANLEHLLARTISELRQLLKGRNAISNNNQKKSVPAAKGVPSSSTKGSFNFLADNSEAVIIMEQVPEIGKRRVYCGLLPGNNLLSVDDCWNPKPPAIGELFPTIKAPVFDDHIPLICRSGKCFTHLDRQFPLYSSSHHLSSFGSRLLGLRIAELRREEDQV